MKFSTWNWIILAVLLGGFGCKPGSSSGTTASAKVTPPPAFQWHFVGSGALAADKSNPVLSGAMQVPSAELAAATLATNLAKLIMHLSGGATAQPAFRASAIPVIRDVLRAESFGHVANGNDWYLGVRIPGAAAAFQRELPGLTGGNVAVVATNGWVFAARNPGGIQSALGAVRPLEGLLKVHANIADWPKDAWPSSILPPPSIRLSAANSNGAVKWTGTAQFPSKLPFQLEAWKMPTNLIRNPLASFVAVRGCSDWLGKSGLFGKNPVSPVPNQFMSWMQPGPFRSFFVAPHPGSDAVLDSVFKVVDEGQRSGHPIYSTVGQFLFDPTNHMIRLATRLPMQPALMTLKNSGQDYLFAAFNPTRRSTNPPPAELFQQLEPAQVVAYHWEVTGGCLANWRDNLQLMDIAKSAPLIANTAPVHQWIEQAGEKADPSATVIRQTASDTLEFTRRAPLGLVAPELYLLARKLDADYARTPGKRSTGPGGVPLPPVPPAPR